MAVAELQRPSRSRPRVLFSKGSSGLALAGALALAIALRAPYATVALGPDEGGVAWVAHQWASGHGSIYGGQWLDRPPLLVALYRLAEPGGTLGIRALGALAALALVVVAARLGKAVGGPRVERVTALLTALLTGSVAIAAVFAPAELLAAVPAAASVATLVAAHRRAQVRWLVAAGALAVGALLIKQSFLDAGLAGLAFLVASTVARGPRRHEAWLAYGFGCALALVPVGAWLLLSHVSPTAFADAIFGFRAESLRVLQASNLPLSQRLPGLALPAVGSGLVLLVPVALVAAWRLRADRVLAVTLAAWTTGGLVGVLGGGSYWPHYLIQLTVPAALGAAVVLSGTRRPVRRAVLAAATGLAIVSAVAGGLAVSIRPPHALDARVAAYVRGHASPGDSFYALYARANLNEAVGLRTPFLYSWSLMMRARPDARSRLLSLLRSAQRPTWIVRWQSPSHWKLDPDGAIAAALQRGYRVVHTDHGRRVLLRTDRPLPPNPRTA